MSATHHYSADSLIAIAFIDVAVMTGLSGAFGTVARRCRQPAVVGEIVAGIALGPSLLGLLPGDLPHQLFPTAVLPYLNLLAQFGLALFMFGVGYELELTELRGQSRDTALVSTFSIAVPFLLGVPTGLLLYSGHSSVNGHRVEPLALALFAGSAMSITAFPVLARILTERGLARSRIGTLSLTCAAIGDFVAWCTLAVVVAVVAAGNSARLVRTLGGSAVFLLVVVLVLRPGARWLVGTPWWRRQSRSTVLGVVLIGVLLCSGATALIGLHPVFGAFAFGIIAPRAQVEQVTAGVGSTIEQMSTLLLPVFFIVTGLSVDLGSIGLAGVPSLLLVITVACASKFVGAAGAARLAGYDRRRAGAIGLLMNTRGLTELIILNIGLGLGVLDRALFTILVIMALVTTVMTGPLLDLVYPPLRQRQDAQDARDAAIPLAEPFPDHRTAVDAPLAPGAEVR